MEKFYNPSTIKPLNQQSDLNLLQKPELLKWKISPTIKPLNQQSDLNLLPKSELLKSKIPPTIKPLNP
jgi:hypothetical protein